ncbi:protein of unknown function [Burkholderia multivorans]
MPPRPEAVHLAPPADSEQIKNRNRARASHLARHRSMMTSMPGQERLHQARQHRSARPSSIHAVDSSTPLSSQTAECIERTQAVRIRIHYVNHNRPPGGGHEHALVSRLRNPSINSSALQNNGYFQPQP